MVLQDVLVRIPVPTREAVVVAAPHLNEAHPALDQPTGHQAFVPEVMPFLLGVDLARPRRRIASDAILLQQRVRFLGQIHHLRCRQLHACRQLVAPDPRIQPRIPIPRLRVPPIQPRHQVMRRTLARRLHIIPVSVREQVRDRILASGIQDRSGVLPRQEGGVPVLGSVRCKSPVIRKHDEGRQVLVDRSESVADPRPHARESGQLEPCRLKVRRLAVHAGLAHQIVHERHLIDHLPEVGHHIAEWLARLTVRPERPHRFHPRTQPILEGLDRFAEITRLSVTFHQLGLVVEQVEMTRRPRHEQLDHPLCPRPMMRLWTRSSGVTRQQTFTAQQARQCDAAQPAA